MEPFIFGKRNPIFETQGSKKPYEQKPVDIEKSKEYEAKTPEPNYSEFGKMGVEYIDLKGREYILAKEGTLVNTYKSKGLIQTRTFFEPNRNRREIIGTQIFWVRIPIDLRGTVEFPQPDGEHLNLYFIRDQVICIGKTNGVFVSGPKKKTGFMILNNFTTFGQVADPSKYAHLFSKKQKLKKVLF